MDFHWIHNVSSHPGTKLFEQVGEGMDHTIGGKLPLLLPLFLRHTDSKSSKILPHRWSSIPSSSSFSSLVHPLHFSSISFLSASSLTIPSLSSPSRRPYAPVPAAPARNDSL